LPKLPKLPLLLGEAISPVQAVASRRPLHDHLVMGSHNFVFGVRELGKQRLFAFHQHDCPALDWLLEFTRGVSSSTPERIGDVVRAADCEADEDDVVVDHLFDAVRGKHHDDLTLAQADDEEFYVAAAVIDVDERCIDFYLASSVAYGVDAAAPTERAALREGLRHMLRAPWHQLAALTERATAARRTLTRLQNDEAMDEAADGEGDDDDPSLDAADDGIMPSLRPFFGHLM
jgi:hypothetical protein